MKTEKAIFIDWDGTLSQSRFWQSWRDNPDDAEQYRVIETALFRPTTPLLQDWMLGKLAAEQITDYLAERIDTPVATLLEALQSSCETMEVAAGALQVVGKARSIGHKVFIATDNMDTFSRWTVPALGLADKFDGILNSADIGAFKKDLGVDGASRFFAETFRTHAIDPSAAVLIDDSPNSRIVERFGMTFYKCNDTTETAQILEGILKQ